ncbi:MAG TPA: glycosyltransferase [Gemmatimonadaceae bacterium]
MSDRIPISVVLATIEPWPDLANCLAVLEPQIAALGGEIIVGDGHGEALDAAKAASSERLSWIRIPGASVFELRARGVERARGDIVAMTEDHVIVDADWCAKIVDAFARNPDAAVVTGPVLNGSTDKLMDWANFLHTFGAFYPPVNRAQDERCPPVANIAFRRSAIKEGPLAPGWLELELNPRLFGAGLCHVSDTLAATHVQSHGFWLTMLAHFDNGRSTTGLSQSAARPRGPWTLFKSGVGVIGGTRKLTRAARASLPLMFLLSCCHAAGEAVGALAGPGRSPARLR